MGINRESSREETKLYQWYNLEPYLMELLLDGIELSGIRDEDIDAAVDCMSFSEHNYATVTVWDNEIASIEHTWVDCPPGFEQKEG